MLIAVEGCAHGELDNIYETIQYLEEKENLKINLLICCGDFQSSRNEGDLKCMAVPEKYAKICSFYKYYNGEKVAPILTIFIGGNHEASNYLQELPYGGWVAPNIFYLGYAGVINVGGIRIGGISGIFKGRDYTKGHYEKAPYDDESKRSVYHIRNLEVFRLKQLSEELDIFLSHDWPTGITDYGNKKKLLKFKPFFKEDIESGQLGSKPCEELLKELQPKYWFAAHLHCKFAAIVPHEKKKTKFLALDKCLPKRKFLQIVDIPHKASESFEISYDLEWLTILYLTNHLLSVKRFASYMPGPNGNERYNFTPTEEEKHHVFEKLNKNLVIPKNFGRTARGYVLESPMKLVTQPEARLNPQTTTFCDILGIDDPIALVAELNGLTLESTVEDSFNNSIINISNNSTETTTPTTPSRPKTSLILPKPKLDNTEEECDDLVEDMKDKCVEDIRDKCVEESVLLNDTNVSVEEIDVKIKQTEDLKLDVKRNESPVPKKFKRRNAEMYKIEENETN